MYDIEIAVLCTLRPDPRMPGLNVFRERMETFAEVGLLNVKDKKVKVKLLVGTEIDDFKDAPFLDTLKRSNVDIEMVTCHKDHVAAKNYLYYADISPDDCKRARWFMKVDDDSVTDVSGLVDALDLEFDHLREYYLISKALYDGHFRDMELLEKYGYLHRWMGSDSKGIWREHEVSVISQAAMKRIASQEDCRKILIERAKFEEGWGDTMLAFAARMAKVYPIPVTCLCELPLLKSFSMVGGLLNHIHYVTPQKTPEIIQILKRMKSPLEIETEYVTTWKGVKLFTFNPTGTFVQKYDEANFWDWDGKTLIIFDSKAVKRLEFPDFDPSKPRILGKCLDDGSEVEIRKLF